MTKPIINPSSEKLILATVKNLPQSLLLSGDKGVGLSTIAKYISELCEVKPTVILPEKDEKINLELGIISVDIMRRLYEDTRSKHSSKQIIIIDYAERMTHQAQNAFLKLLEEPGLGVYFILVSNSVSKLLPTIISRVKKIDIKPILTEQSKQLMDSLKIIDKTKRSQLLFMADGLPAELIRLSSDDNYFEIRSAIIRDARELLTGSLYRKLLVAQKYKDNREAVLLLLLDMSKILKLTIEANPQIETISKIDSILETYSHIEANSNIRLALAKMIL